MGVLINRDDPFMIVKFIICADDPVSIATETAVQRQAAVADLMRAANGRSYAVIEDWRVKELHKQGWPDMAANKVVPGVCLSLVGRFQISSIKTAG